MRSNQAQEPLTLGDRLSQRYLVVERIASGGHSIVYRGEDQRLSRPVCIKVFHRLNARDAVYQTAYEHFVQEAFALSKLTHPNTLRIYDFGHLGDDGTESGPPFQISEYMNHGTLASVVQTSGPLGHSEAIRVITALGGALGEAHDHGIIHRDIKPQNILFGVVGRKKVAKLADFGIAKSLAATAERLDNQAEDTAVVAGRPLLMYSLRWAAPEQLTGDAIVRASDTYSLALTLTFMLTGNVVFISSDQMDPYEQRQRSGEFIEAACASAELPDGVVDRLKEACLFDAAARPADVEEFASSLVDAFQATLQAPRGRPRLEAVSNQTGPMYARAATPTPTPPRRLHTTDEVHSIGDRRGYFIAASGGHADVTCCNGVARLRITFVPAADGFCIHIKGMNCFVALTHGRPSSAVQFERDGRCDLVTPNRRQLANVAVSMGAPAAGHRVFTVGTESVALATDECPQVAMLDFGAGNDCLFVYRPSFPSEQPKRSLWRKTTS